MAYADQQTSGNRITAIVIVALIHVFVGYLFISGLAVSAVKNVVERVTTIDIEEPPPPEPEDEPPPPEPQETAPPPPVAPPPAPPAPPSQARGATTRGEGRWAARIQENYPSRALREEVEGTVGVSVVVSPEGRVASCRVSRSSGSSVLDDAACRGMERYARFNPALDAAGNPTTGSYNTSIVYRLN